MSKNKQENPETKKEEIVQEEEVKQEQEEAIEETSEEVEQAPIDSQEEIGRLNKCLESSQLQIGKLTQSLNELNDKCMRLYAEFDNYRKRSQAEIQNAKIKGIDFALSAFFPCMDSIDRAILICKDEDQLKGYKLVLKQFENALTQIGVTAIEPMGQEFDPQYHNAVIKEIDPENAGKVIDVLQKGYMFKETLLRPAMVKVATEE